MVTDFPIQAILDNFVERIVEIMPVTAAGVTLITPGQDPEYIAASDDAALRFEKLQTELGEGPCLEAYRTGEPVSVPDLRRDDRFSHFAPRAVEAGLLAVFTFPLRHGDHRFGALDLYRDSPGPLSPDALAAARTLADVAAAYLHNAEARADLTETSERSQEAALHDALTGLPNRVLMLERLEHAFRKSRRTGSTSALFYVDLDRFKTVNDSHGHRSGDDLLVAVAARLTAILRPGDTLARLAGDEFVILCEDLTDPAQAEIIASRIHTSMATPFVLSDDIDVEMTASVGIAFTGSGEQDAAEDLLHNADLAMYRAKRAGGARHATVDLREQHLAERQAGLGRDLRGAALRGEMHLEYQPIVTTVDGTVIGVEALLRWAHPSRGLVAPMVLVPLAEASGQIVELGRWVLQQAWSDRSDRRLGLGSGNLAMSVNVSAHQFMSAGFVDAVAAGLAVSPAEPALLTLEITESVFLIDAQRALVVLNDLKDLGVLLALDDFGTGYSSLSFLRQFPVDIVKIDRAFVSDVCRDSATHTIVNAVIQLAHGLGMTVVAEGVESADQQYELEILGCDACQGYFFARPMPINRLDTLLRDSRDGTDHHLPIHI